MYRIIFIIIMTFILNCNFRNNGNQSVGNSDKPSGDGLNDVFYISKEVRIQLKSMALDGNNDVALKLSEYYDFYESNTEEAIYWAQISAENGDIDGQYTYGFQLYECDLKTMTNEEKMMNKQRAVFWLKKAAHSGHKGAQEKLDEIVK